MKITPDDPATNQHAATVCAAAPPHDGTTEAEASLLSESASGLLDRARSIQKPPPAPPPMLDLQSQTGFTQGDEYHVDDLLQYHGRHFVECAHLALLKRAAASSELDRFTDGLRSGRTSKIDILETLYVAAEGRAACVRLNGLPSRTARRLDRAPIISRLLRVLKGVWRLPVLMDNQRRFEAYALARQQDIADHVNQLARQRGEQLYIIVEDMAETLVMLAEELHSASAQFAETSEKTATLLESSAKLDDKLNEIVAASTRLAAEIAAQREQHAAREGGHAAKSFNHQRKQT